MYITQVNSKSSRKPIDIIKASYHEFLNKVKSQSADKNRNVVKTQYSKELYEYTKNFLEERKNQLSPLDKRKIFDRYIKVWVKAECELDIADTDYAERYKNNSWSKYHTGYNPRVPMLAGFNLEGICLIDTRGSSYLIFPSVNLKNADMSYACFAYSHFEDCDMSNVKTMDTNLNQCPIRSCNLSYTNLLNARLCEVTLIKCNLFATQLERNQDVRYCTYILPDDLTLSESAPESRFANLLRVINAEKQASIGNGFFKSNDYFPFGRLLDEMSDVIGHQYSFFKSLDEIKKIAGELNNQKILDAANACVEIPEEFKVKPRYY